MKGERGLVMLLAGAILAVCGGSPAAPAPTHKPSASVRIVPQRSQSPLVCPYPSVRPTYLPWLDLGEEVPEPDAHQVTGDDGTSYAFLDWRNPRWKRDFPPYFVELLRKS
jgi:hypothetical protein